MSQSRDLVIELPRVSKLMSDFLTQWETDIAKISRTSAEYWEQLQDELSDRFGQWPQKCGEFRRVVSKLPKHMRQSEFFSSMLVEIESFDRNARIFFARLKTSRNMSTSEQGMQNGYVLHYHMVRLREQIKSVSDSLSKLHAHPLFLKYVRGEAIYAERHQLQWRRKFFHMGNGLLFLHVFYFAGLSREFLLWFGLGFMLLALTIEFLRHAHPGFNAVTCRLFGPIMRSHEVTSVNSAIYYIVAMYLIYVVFPIEVAVLTLLYVAIGDPVAGVVGSRYGRHIMKPGVSWEGFLACFGASTVLTAIFSLFVLDEITLTSGSLFLFSVASGLVAALAESSFKFLDDNLVIPMLSAPVVHGLLLALS